MFSTLIVAYLFLGGAASGAFFVMASWSLAFHRRGITHPHRLHSAFKALLARVYAIALITLIASATCLVWDLLYPERALLIFLRPRPTLLTFGAFALAALMLIGLALTIANVFDTRLIGGRARKLLEVLTIPASLAVMLYTGLFLASNASIPFWSTPWLTVLFLLSSLSAGVSGVLLIDYFVQGQTILLRATKPLQRLHLVCLALEGGALAGFIHSAIVNPEAGKSLALLAQPDMLATGIVGVAAMGIVFPFLLESYALTRKECRAIPFSDVICLIGSFCLRYCIIMCGAH